MVFKMSRKNYQIDLIEVSFLELIKIKIVLIVNFNLIDLELISSSKLFIIIKLVMVVTKDYSKHQYLVTVHYLVNHLSYFGIITFSNPKKENIFSVI